MASETVYQLTGRYPQPIPPPPAFVPPIDPSPPELYLDGTNAGYKSQGLLKPVESEHATFGMPDQRAACAATHAIKKLYNVIL